MAVFPVGAPGCLAIWGRIKTTLGGWNGMKNLKSHEFLKLWPEEYQTVAELTLIGSCLPISSISILNVAVFHGSGLSAIPCFEDPPVLWRLRPRCPWWNRVQRRRVSPGNRPRCGLQCSLEQWRTNSAACGSTAWHFEAANCFTCEACWTNRNVGYQTNMTYGR